MEYILIDTLRYGLPYALLALGIFMSYRVLDMADLSCEGTFTLGGALSAVLLVLGLNPFLATFIGVLAGFVAGIITGLIHTKLKITALLSGIITMTGLFSINLVVMGLAPTVIKDPAGGFIVNYSESGYAAAVYLSGLNINGENITTIFESFLAFFTKTNYNMIMISLILVVAIAFIAYWFFGTEIGMSLRATGINPKMARAQGINTNSMIILGLGISNALIAMSGSLFAQVQGSASSTMGIGVLVIGLASIIIGEAIFGKRTFKNWIISVILGAILYYFIVVIAIRLGLPSYYQKLLYAILILLVLSMPLIKKILKPLLKKFSKKEEVNNGNA